ncbi:hypothetical protein MTR_6g013395 [Medicago truncatula]|uniref:Uncharacterized protein n=1 Tax=Medicago truncatula TaxID=3880 RepID=A0A072UGV1_MEDTR|nr:hypothetical protein MTR_6g013395 [Medicago truncatula]
MEVVTAILKQSITTSARRLPIHTNRGGNRPGQARPGFDRPEPGLRNKSQA